MIVLVLELLWATLWPLIALFVILCVLFVTMLLTTRAIDAWNLQLIATRKERHALMDEIEEFLSDR